MRQQTTQRSNTQAGAILTVRTVPAPVMNLCLRSVMQGQQEGWGQMQGQQVRARLETLLASSPQLQVVQLSLAGLTRTDVPFARASVIELARSQRTRYGFCLVEVTDVDLLDNWDAAASRCDQPLTAWLPDGSCRMLGPQPCVGLRTTLDYVLSVPVARSSEGAARLHTSIANTSNKLRQLWQAGYILRHERSDGHRGVAYDYIRIGARRPS